MTAETNGDGLSISVTPNPFGSSTAIVIGSITDSRVRLGVYDLSGRKVTDLFEGAIKGQIGYEFAFDAAALPSGVYVARLSSMSGGSTEAKMVVVR
jgi:hypothetical protein